MATEIALEVKVNSGSSVNAVKELKKEIKELESLSLQAGNAGNEALSRKYAAAAGAARDKMADFKKEIQGVSDAGSKLGAIAQVGSTIASGFQAAAGASALFGASGKDLEKVMVKIQAATALAQGAQALANATEDIAIAKRVIYTTVTNAASAASTFFGTATAAAMAVATAGISVVVGLVVALVYQLTLANKEEEKNLKLEEQRLDLLKRRSEESDADQTQLDRNFQRNRARLEAEGKSEAELFELEQTYRGEKIFELEKFNSKLDKTKADEQEIIRKNNDKIEQLQIENDVKFYGRVTERNKKEQEEAIKNGEELRKIEEENAKKFKFKPSFKIEDDPNENIDTAEGQRIADAQSLNALLLSIGDEARFQEVSKEKQMADEIAAYKKTKAEEERVEKNKQREEDLQIATQGLQAIQNVSDIFFAAKLSRVKKGSKEEEKILRQQFNQQKKMNIAMATINGAQAITSILAQYPKFDGGIAMAIALGSSIAATAASIAKIASTKFEGGGGGGATAPAGGGGGGSITTPNAPTIPTFNPQGTIIPQNNNNKNEAVKAYVLEDDVSSTQNRIRDIKTKALYG